MLGRARPLVVLLAVSMALAGCINKGDVAEEPTAPAQTNDTLPTTLPDGREFTAVQETNKTEEGVGGMEHKHDYWQGFDQITIFDQDVSPSLTPVFERGDDSKVWIAFINLGNISEEDNRSALIYEGTGKVDFTLTGGPAWATSYQMTFRTAASDWTPWQPIAVGETFSYEPQKIETDMPHSFRSLWNWKLQAVAPVPVTGDLFVSDVAPEGEPMHVTIVVHRARDVDDWPGHPAFYDGVDERIVAENKPGKSSVQHAADVLVYGVEPDQVVPDRLISMGTRTLDVYVNITRLELPPGVENAGFHLFWRSADTTPNSLGHSQFNNETDAKTFAYWRLEVDDDMVDSPYQPTSRFSFKVLATPADSSVVLCYRCMPYELEYTITVIARPDENAPKAELA